MNCEISEPHTIPERTPVIRLKRPAVRAAAYSMAARFKAGDDLEIADLELLDEVLKVLDDINPRLVCIVSSRGSIMPLEMARRLRFERGLDIR